MTPSDQTELQAKHATQLDIIDRITKELATELSPEINEDDSGVTYYYTENSVKWVIERVTNQVNAELEQSLRKEQD